MDKESGDIKNVLDHLKREFENREKLAREMHDGIFQTLAIINSAISRIKADLCEAGTVVSKNDCSEMEMLDDLVKKSIKEGRTIMRGIRYPELDEKNDLCNAIESYIKIVSPYTKMEIVLICEDDLNMLTFVETENIFSSTIELINNSLKYSSASSLKIHLKLLQKSLSIKVVDDGQGFEDAAEMGTGLSIIRTRIACLKGGMKIDGSRGCIVEMEVPLKNLN
jgi:two-component system, NarL family, sensor histidine kinase LiaS